MLRPRIVPSTSQSPDVRKWGVPLLAGLNSAIWLNPSFEGTMSRYPESRVDASRLDGRGKTPCFCEIVNKTSQSEASRIAHFVYPSVISLFA